MLALPGCGGAASGLTYELSAQSATVDSRDAQGNCWESDCGPPRTYACATLAGLRVCSTPLASNTPQWFEALHPFADGDALRAGLTVEYLHGTRGAADASICRRNIVLSDAIFTAGRLDLPCGSGVLTLGVRAN